LAVLAAVLVAALAAVLPTLGADIDEQSVKM
jgi:hypothetical protein